MKLNFAQQRGEIIKINTSTHSCGTMLKSMYFLFDHSSHDLTIKISQFDVLFLNVSDPEQDNFLIAFFFGPLANDSGNNDFLRRNITLEIFTYGVVKLIYFRVKSSK